MEVDIRIKDTDLADAVRTYAARRIRFALGRFASRVGRIVVRISDINGKRGGVDKCCHIGAEVLPAGKVVLQQIDADLFTAIDRASERAGRTLRRNIERARKVRTQRDSVRIPLYTAVSEKYRG
jgi:putative sigma-54 modulation protein